MRTKQEVLEIIRSAFLPLRCEAELHDYDQQVRFRVFDPEDEAILRLEDTPVDGLLDGPKLKTIIIGARDRISRKGHELYEWDF